MAWSDLQNGWNTSTPKPKKIEIFTRGGQSYLIQDADVQLDPNPSGATGTIFIKDNRGTGKVMVIIDKSDIVSLVVKE